MSDTSSTETVLGGLPRPGFVETLASELTVTAATLAPTIAVSARRVGVLADTHCHSPDGSDLADTVLEALQGLDLILHCGDIDSLGVLDRLETIAPVIAVRSKIDPMADGVRLHQGPLLIRAGHTLIGISTDLPDLMDPAVLFGTDVDIALSGTSHVPHVGRVGLTLLVNPGSPTIPLSSSGPTVATIELDGPRSTVRIVHLPRSQP
jgi:uncharacterized protein